MDKTKKELAAEEARRIIEYAREKGIKLDNKKKKKKA